MVCPTFPLLPSCNPRGRSDLTIFAAAHARRRRRACLRAALRGFCADLVQAGGRWADAVAVADGTPAPPRDDADAEDASARVPPAHRGAAWQALEVAVAGVREVGIDGA